MKKRISCKVIKTISLHNDLLHTNGSYIKHLFDSYGIYNNSTSNLGTLFYTEKMKKVRMFNNDNFMDNSLDSYA